MNQPIILLPIRFSRKQDTKDNLVQIIIIFKKFLQLCVFLTEGLWD